MAQNHRWWFFPIASFLYDLRNGWFNITVKINTFSVRFLNYFYKYGYFYRHISKYKLKHINQIFFFCLLDLFKYWYSRCKFPNTHFYLPVFLHSWLCFFICFYLLFIYLTYPISNDVLLIHLGLQSLYFFKPLFLFKIEKSRKYPL